MILLFISGGFGALFRYAFSFWLLRFHLSKKIQGFVTVTINGIGSFALGLCDATLEAASIYLFLSVGFLGAFTTFSSFSYEALQLFFQKRYVQAVCYVLFTGLFCMMAYLCGYHCLMYGNHTI